MQRGLVEQVSRYYSIGWLSSSDDGIKHVYAMLDGRVIGAASANIVRDDLLAVSASAHAFIIVFKEPVTAEQIDAVEVYAAGLPEAVQRAHKVKLQRDEARQIFVLGSPRSGTSEMGATLSSCLGLPWLGECHAATGFAGAADALQGNPRSDSDFLRFMAKQGYRNIAASLAQAAYYFVHNSASFLDKTPGTDMIKAAPFLAGCFPAAKLIYLRRNGISNVLSRMTKFGGRFDEHCADWVAALVLWEQVKASLPGYVEIDQEEMLNAPEGVGEKVAAYLGVPELAERIGLSFRNGRHERTGAGIGRTTLASTGWSPEQTQQFRLICGPTMTQHGYEVA